MKIGLIGLGAIGSFLAKELQKEKIEIAWVLDKDAEKAKKIINELKLKAKIVETPAYNVDLIVEAASQQAVAEFVPNALKKTNVMIMSVGALADEKLLKKIEAVLEKSKKKLLIPSGAIAGLDAIKSAKNHLEGVVLETRKNPKGFGRNDLEERVLFEGNAREACKLFPANINVSATLALAGIGFEKTKVKIISDPAVETNQHTITAKGKSGSMVFKTVNVPMPENPKTSFLAALAALRKMKEMQEKIEIG